MKVTTKRVAFLLVSVLMLFIRAECIYAQSLAFEGAIGFGKYTQGGNEGQILVVDSLDDKGNDAKGTFRWAVNQPFPRLVVFNVSGIIQLKRPLNIQNDNLTIAGQTSPLGIVISGAQTKVSANQVIIRFMRFRPGNTNEESDALFIRNQQDIIIDHCSLSWANDEVASFYNNTRFTLQNSIISESLNDAGHSKGKHGYGGIWGGRYASFVQNVLVSHTRRNPRLNGWRMNAPYQQASEFVDIRNNVIANWASNAGYGGEGGKANLVANYYKPGPATKRIRFFELKLVENVSTSLHVSNNVMHANDMMTNNNILGIDIKDTKRNQTSHIEKLNATLSSEPIEPVALDSLVESTLTAQEAYEHLVIKRNVGARLTRHKTGLDPVDRRVLKSIKANFYEHQSGIIDNAGDAVHWPSYTSYFYSKVPVPDFLTDTEWRVFAGLTN